MDDWLAVLVAVIVLVAALCFLRKHDECEARHGVMVRAFMGYECVTGAK